MNTIKTQRRIAAIMCARIAMAKVLTLVQDLIGDTENAHHFVRRYTIEGPEISLDILNKIEEGEEVFKGSHGSESSFRKILFDQALEIALTLRGPEAIHLRLSEISK